MKTGLLIFFLAAGASVSKAQAAAQVRPLLTAEAFVTETLLPFQMSGAPAGEVRKYEVEGATRSECRVSRDVFYPNIFQVKCVSAKDGLRLKLTLYENGSIKILRSTPFSVRALRDGWSILRPAASAGGA